ncbi:hypothetical protein [Nocardia sp. CA-145437]
MDEYLAQLRELAADVTALESLGVVAADAPSMNEITCGAEESERKESER